MRKNIIADWTLDFSIANGKSNHYVKSFWLNLPVKNIYESKTFFSLIGFTFRVTPSNPNTSACYIFDEKTIVLMLFSEPVFTNFIKNKICNTQRVHKVLLSIGAESNEEVGGNQDWMYGGVFTDLGGHRLNVLHMDRSKIFASR